MPLYVSFLPIDGLPEVGFGYASCSPLVYERQSTGAALLQTYQIACKLRLRSMIFKTICLTARHDPFTIGRSFLHEISACS